MKLGDFLKTLAGKLNLQNDQALVALLARPELADQEIDDSLANPLNNGLMSLDGAKNNTLVKTHFTSQALNGVDTELMSAVTELELGDDAIAQFQGEKNTYNKLRLFKEKVKEIKSKKVETNDQSKKAEYEKQITELNTKMATLIGDSKKGLSDMTATHSKEIVDFMIQFSLQDKPYANKDMAPKVNMMIARSLLDEALASSGAVLVRDGNSLKLKQASSPDLDFYDKDHKPISYEDFATKILADNKLLQVSTPPGTHPGTPPGFGQRVAIPGLPAPVNTAKMDSALASSMADLTQQ